MIKWDPTSNLISWPGFVFKAMVWFFPEIHHSWYVTYRSRVILVVSHRERWASFNGLVYWKIYRKPWFLPSNIGVSCKFSRHPILWIMSVWVSVYLPYLPYLLYPFQREGTLSSENWLVVWNMAFMTFHSVGNFIFPTDEIHDFSEG